MSDPNQEFQPPPPPSVGAPVERKRPTHLMTVGGILFGVGIVILVLGIIKVLVGGIGTGAAVCFLGLVLFAVSFISLPEPAANAPEAIGFPGRIAGMFFEPTRIFQSLRAHPHWVSPLILIALLNICYAQVFYQRLTPERIVNFTFDKLADSPFKPPPQARQDALDTATQPIQRVETGVKSMVGAFIFLMIASAFYLLGVLAFGGRMNFWQTMAVLAHALMPVLIVQRVVSFIILFVKSPDDIHPLIGQETLVQDNLGILFKSSEHPVLFVAAGAIGVLSFYKLWLTAKGLHAGGQKVSSSTGWGVAITFWLLLLLFGIAIAAIFPGFLS